jgi:hypothetical protein
VSAESFGRRVLRELTEHNELARFLSVRARGKTAVLGYEVDDDWVPLFRFANGSAAFNVADLQIRHRETWQPTFVRGIPAAIAETLAGPLRPFWELHAP